MIRRIPYTEEDIRVDGNARWLCECSCGKYKVFNGGALRSKSVTSCGHTRGEAALLRALRGKTEQQQLLRTNNEAFKEALESFENVNGRKPNSTDVGLMLGTDYNTALAMTKARGFEYLVSKTRSRSALEIDIQTKIWANKSSEDYIINDRDTLGSEIDIYFPDCKLGVEVNGDYWHSELQKSKNYHQDKSILAAKNGILLFHIFEHEWRNERTRDIITGMLMNKINGTCATKIYARECSVRQISAVEAKAFNELWHIDGHANHRVAFGLFYRNELVSLMSFGISRFGDKNSVELIRYTTRYDIGVTGGAERLLKAFRDIYNGEIVTYCDIAKSDGSVYKRLGFTLDKITVPGYVWFEQSRHDVLTRYQCQKRNLVKHGLGDNSMTEDDIMHSLGYVKIYDCGNYKFILK